MEIKPWEQVPFELIKHAEEHRIANGDFDKRIALISYDNAIEVSISTYLNLHKEQRGGKTYDKKKVADWLHDYHTKLDFFCDEFIVDGGYKPPFTKEEIIHYHRLRNDLYHEGRSLTPRENDIEGVRTAALYIFSALFTVDGIKLLKTSPMLHVMNIDKAIIRGEGNAMRKIRLKEGIVTFNIKYSGIAPINMKLYDAEQRTISTIIPHSETFPRSDNVFDFLARNAVIYCNSANIKISGEYIIRVNTDSHSSWEVKIEQ